MWLQIVGTLTPGQQPPPPNLENIKKQVFEKWPTIELLDFLKETNFRTSFTSVFATTASREYLDEDQLIKRLLLCIFAYGTNTGLKRIAASNEPKHIMQWIKPLF
ncbi:MAG: Tn3 family transposase [Alphaproteobacteria bacterium]|nr:Tn3 family transposase [Alphaproteobacteria bacterium]